MPHTPEWQKGYAQGKQEAAARIVRLHSRIVELQSRYDDILAAYNNLAVTPWPLPISMSSQ
jgi:hypothetical protein